MTIRLFEVGGSIRDELMGITEFPDRDFCAESPEGWKELLTWCHENMQRVFLVTPQFFTVRGKMPNGTSIDIVMCRKDGPSSDGRHPDHVDPGTLIDDLKRRDFTMNALAREVNPATLEPVDEIIDLFDGITDIQTGVLSAVGDVNARFEQDGLRVLRAARFCVTKNMKPDLWVERALLNPRWWKFVAETVSEDRIRVELHKMFRHNTVDALRFLADNCSHEALERLFANKSTIWLKPTVEKK